MFANFRNGFLFPPFFENKAIKFVSSFCDFAIEGRKPVHLIFSVQFKFGNWFILHGFLLIFFVKDNIGLFLLKVGQICCFNLCVILTNITGAIFNRLIIPFGFTFLFIWLFIIVWLWFLWFIGFVLFFRLFAFIAVTYALARVAYPSILLVHLHVKFLCVLIVTGLKCFLMHSMQ